MSTGKKKPPIDLRDLEVDEDEPEEESGRGRPGNLTYMERRGRNDEDTRTPHDWWGIVAGVVISVFLAGVLIFVATPSKKDITTLQDNQKELAGQSTTIQKEVQTNVDKSLVDLQNKVDTAVTEARSAKSSLDAYALKSSIPAAPNMSEYARKSDVPTASDLSQYATKADVTALQTTITALQKQVDALGSSDSITGSDFVRWNYEVLIDSSVGATGEITSVLPRIIEEDGYYDLVLDIEWDVTPAATAREYLSIVLTPRDRGSAVFIDEGSTYLEMVKPSIRGWDTFVDTNRDGTTRRIVFEYPYDLDLSSGLMSQRLTLEMDLVYE